MCPVITILGKAIPMYGVCIVLGAVIAGGIAVLFLQKPYRACHEGYDVAAAAAFAMVGVFVGGLAGRGICSPAAMSFTGDFWGRCLCCGYTAGLRVCASGPCC